jgi:hypothetical protein
MSMEDAMIQHRAIFGGVWLAGVVALLVFPGFEMRAWVAGLIVGGWALRILPPSSVGVVVQILLGAFGKFLLLPCSAAFTSVQGCSATFMFMNWAEQSQSRGPSP